MNKATQTKQYQKAIKFHGEAAARCDARGQHNLAESHRIDAADLTKELEELRA